MRYTLRDLDKVKQEEAAKFPWLERAINQTDLHSELSFQSFSLDQFDADAASIEQGTAGPDASLCLDPTVLHRKTEVNLYVALDEALNKDWLDKNPDAPDREQHDKRVRRMQTARTQRTQRRQSTEMAGGRRGLAARQNTRSRAPRAASQRAAQTAQGAAPNAQGAAHSHEAAAFAEPPEVEQELQDASMGGPEIREGYHRFRTEYTEVAEAVSTVLRLAHGDRDEVWQQQVDAGGTQLRLLARKQQTSHATFLFVARRILATRAKIQASVVIKHTHSLNSALVEKIQAALKTTFNVHADGRHVNLGIWEDRAAQMTSEAGAQWRRQKAALEEKCRVLRW